MYNGGLMYEVIKDMIIPIISIFCSILAAYITTKYTVRRELKQGRLRLLELVRRYFINVINAFDQETNRIKNNTLSKKMYVEELKAILTELQNLVAHPYFSVLVTKYPQISKLLVQLRRELVEHDVQKLFSINKGTMGDFWKLYQILKVDMKKIMNSELDKTIESLDKKNM